MVMKRKNKSSHVNFEFDSFKFCNVTSDKYVFDKYQIIYTMCT